MNKDIYDKHYQIVGGLQALQDAANRAFCMPSDAATEALLGVARNVLEQAVISARRYADERTNDSEA